MKAITFLYFLLLVYIIAALVFWGFSLNKQNMLIVNNELDALHTRIDSIVQPAKYEQVYNEIKARENSRKNQYLGEGATFLIIILIGAGVVYTSIRSNHLLNKQQTNFMLSITHELKSPIAAVKLNLQTLLKRKLNEDTQIQLLNRSVNEANRLDDLCNNLLLASQMESKHFKPSIEEVNLSQETMECVAAYESRGHNLYKVHIEPDKTAMADTFLWKLAVNNLLENAVKYAPSGSVVAVSLQQQDDELVLSIADEGIGISDNDKSKIFKKFYRVGNENARKTKGTGLGLYLTSKIVHQLKGVILVKDNQPKGTVFEISLPIQHHS